MPDPHVDWLEYELKVFSWKFDNPEPLTWCGRDFGLRLDEKGLLRVNMLTHFATVEEARRSVEPFLQTWEISVTLSYGQHELRFEFRKGHVIDRDPQPGIARATTAHLILTVGAVVVAACEVVKAAYPPVPTNFEATPDVISLCERFERYKGGRELTTSFAYFVLTVLEYRFDSRKNAAKALSVDPKVLDAVGQLSTAHGDLTTARKLKRTIPLRPLTAEHVHWLDIALPLLIRRLGESAAGGSFPQLTMSQLPHVRL